MTMFHQSCSFHDKNQSQMESNSVSNTKKKNLLILRTFLEIILSPTVHTGKQWTLYTFSLLRERDTCTDALSSDGTLNQLHCLECYILNIGNLILVLKSIKFHFFFSTFSSTKKNLQLKKGARFWFNLLWWMSK